MATQAEILPDNFMLIPGEQLVESLADESQRMEVCDATICEYADLNLDGQVPWRGSWGTCRFLSNGESRSMNFRGLSQRISP